jgi:hypothetical protein
LESQWGPVNEDFLTSQLLTVARLAMWLSPRGCALALGQLVDGAGTLQVQSVLEHDEHVMQGRITFYFSNVASSGRQEPSGPQDGNPSGNPSGNSSSGNPLG